MNANPTIFKNEDWEMFCNAGTLSQKAGVQRDKIGLLVAKELADNALDVGKIESLGYIEENSDGGNCFYIKNDGDGIPGTDEDIANLFSVKRPLLSTKRIRIPQRGALGNGLRVVAGAVISFGGSIEVSTNGRTLKMFPQESGETFFERIGDCADTGTLIKVMVKGFHNVLPWAQMATCMTGGESYKGKTSPFWYDSDSFYSLLRSIQGNVTIRDFLSRSFDGCSGRKAGEIVSDSYAGRVTNTITREEADQILKKARSIAKEVKPCRLGYAGDIEGQIAYYRDEHVFEIGAGRGDLSATIPAVIEFWAFENDSEKQSQFFVNRTPITGEVGVTFNKNYLYISGCGINVYREKKLKVDPSIWVNVITPYMPITSDGKEPDFSYLKKQIGAGIEKLTGRVSRQLPAGVRGQGESKVTIKDVVRINLDEAIAKTSGCGAYRYSLRQLFYAIRPYVMDALEKEPDYQYFTGIITEIETERGTDLPGIYRDNRGTIRHPHTGDEIPLGTMNVEQYVRPKHYFNKILYLEKEGFF